MKLNEMNGVTVDPAPQSEHSFETHWAHKKTETGFPSTSFPSTH